MTEDVQPLSFPDAPRAKLDRVIGDLVTAAQEVLATQGRLRSLVEASRLVTSELDLPVVLRRIIAAAVELVGARYGAIGVIGADGSLAQFIHVGMPDDLARHIGHLPEGHGLLGALIEEQQPIRLEHLREDPRSSGFPAHHPPMDSFLGVPVRVRGEVYGNLYLSEHGTGAFSAEDQELLIALADTAGAAIDHARLFDESQRRQRWSAASAEVTAALLSDHAEDSLAILADRVAGLADADLVCVALPATGSTMIIEIARGELADSFSGRTFDSRGTLAGQALESGQPVLSDLEAGSIDLHLAFGPTMALPFASSDAPTGVLTVSRLPGSPRFTTGDLDMAADFATQVSVALTLASVRADRQRIAVLEDRGRIARDLHDNVIQRLFGAGLSLQALAGGIADPGARSKIAQQVDALDAAIAEIRTAIFTLTTAPDSNTPSLRHRVIDVLGEMSDLFEKESPRLTFTGAVDLMVSPELAEDVIAVVREGLSNVARHAGAEHTSTSISVAAGRLVVQIEDDGRGIGAGVDRSSGTGNLSTRAAARGGEFSLQNGESGGTVLRWDVPLETTEGRE